MHADVTEPGRTVVPTLRYRDVAAATDWLCKAFGFERHLVVPGENGAIRYAELTFGGGMIMLGPVADTAFDKLMTQPVDVGGAETQICYLFVQDANSHYVRAKAAGAEIVLDIEEEDGSGRGYSCRDLEGHIWNFGTYNPWKRQSDRDRESDRRAGGLGRALKRVAAVSALLLTVAASAVVVAWMLGATELTLSQFEPSAWARAPADTTDGVEPAIRDAREQLARERSARETAERNTRAAREQLVQERNAKEAAERAGKEAQGHLAQERSAKEAAERAAREAREQLGKAGSENAINEMREQLARERSALESAQRIARETREQLSLAERAAAAVQEQLAEERAAREAGERASRQAQEQLTSAKEETERAKLQAAKERAAKEAADRAAKEARERKTVQVRRVYPQAAAEPKPPMPTPFTGKSDN